MNMYRLKRLFQGEWDMQLLCCYLLSYEDCDVTGGIYDR